MAKIEVKKYEAIKHIEAKYWLKLGSIAFALLLMLYAIVDRIWR